MGIPAKNDQFRTEVFPTELREIHRRRKAIWGGGIKGLKEELEFVCEEEDKLREAEKELQKCEEKHFLARWFYNILPVQENVITEEYVDEFRGDAKENPREVEKNPQKRKEKHFLGQCLIRFSSMQEFLKPGEKVRECRKEFEKKKKSLAAKAEPTTQLGLIGLALSGGGIRSATFNLGVLQALNERRILKHIDYLSTVSGGGYIGSCISSMLNTSLDKSSYDKSSYENEFPFRHELGKEEPMAFKHLRSNSNYLTPGGFVDWLQIPARLLLGILINIIVILPFLVLAMCLTKHYYGDALRNAIYFTITEQSLKDLKSNGLRDGKTLKKLENILDQELKEAQIKTIIADEEKTELILKYAERKSTIKTFYRYNIQLVVITIIYILLFLLGTPFRRWIESRRQRWANMNRQDSDHWMRKLLKRTSKLPPLYTILFCIIGGIILIQSVPTALLYFKLNGWDHVTVSLVTAISLLISYLSANKAAKYVSQLTGKITLWVMGLLGPVIVVLIYFSLCYWCIFTIPDDYSVGTWHWLLLAFVVWVLLALFMDVNVTSLHRFYRDRLSKVYLIDKNMQHKDGLKLQHLNAHQAIAPYQLINAALNVQGSKRPELRGRKADFFIFSKHFSGSESTGYHVTKELEESDPSLDLGTAMAISGAAAAPNMGATTIKPLVFLMALFNIRLGYWLPNPSCVKNGSFQKRLIRRVGPIYLLWELFSKLNEKSWYINLSDGGHIENLGIYELLRRKCKFIIACDAEADPDLKFNGLATLIRYARIDMGIDIDIELDNLRKQENGLVGKHCALGKISYGKGENAESGYLLYIKSSVSGDENEYIREYRLRHPHFPHETTADQFFDEVQFEAHRALGYHIVNDLFLEKKSGKKTIRALPRDGDFVGRKEHPVKQWLDKLKVSLQPSFQLEDKIVALHEQLGALEQEFRDPDVAEYTYQMYRELGLSAHQELAHKKNHKPISPPEVAERTEKFRKIFHLCNLQMKLMENAFVVLQLDNPRNLERQINRGWLNLFQRWAQAPYFKLAWAVSIGTYSTSFQTFCKQALNLDFFELPIKCRKGGWEELSEVERLDLEALKGKNMPTASELKDLKENSSKSRIKIWLAEISFPDMKKPFAFGFFAIRDASNLNQVIFYRIKDYYRRMMLLDKMVAALAQELRRRNWQNPIYSPGLGDERKPTVLMPKAMYHRGHKLIFKRYGFNVKIIDANKIDRGNVLQSDAPILSNPSILSKSS